uniref:Predicted protein n=1 Tax=Hordeum vulgare subsp. vulgare TaxID=112509 RepID=F2EC42_HORVV|nr:predicted protein [Hordeum vulgare subsp. vulgare]
MEVVEEDEDGLRRGVGTFSAQSGSCDLTEEEQPHAWSVQQQRQRSPAAAVAPRPARAVDVLAAEAVDALASLGHVPTQRRQYARPQTRQRWRKTCTYRLHGAQRLECGMPAWRICRLLLLLLACARVGGGYCPAVLLLQVARAEGGDGEGESWKSGVGCGVTTASWCQSSSEASCRSPIAESPWNARTRVVCRPCPCRTQVKGVPNLDYCFLLYKKAGYSAEIYISLISR